jgi:hypothetical protein
MALQLIIVNQAAEAVERQLGDIAVQCEIFPMSSRHVGVSVPKKVLDGIGGDGPVRAKFSRMNYYDLYKGQWVVKK